MSSSAAESPTESSAESASPPPALLHGPDAGTAEAAAEAPPRPAAVLKGGPRGLEFLVDGRAKVDAIAAALCTRLAEAPAFFRGSSVRVRVEDGPLAPGVLARIDDIATRFELRILEVGAARAAKADPESANPPDFATGSTAVAAAAAAEPAVGSPAAAASAAAADAPGAVAEAAPAAGSGPSAEPSAASVAAAVAAVSEEREADTRIVIGPVRSGVILEHRGNLIVIGDVNPGAEIRAERNIIVLGRLRGIAHAGIGRTYGFILALKLEPQQLRIARQIARAGDADGPVAAAEIAYVTSNKIVVERYAGKLPLGLANSM
jgi:septum site-determining protein MinC